MVTERDERRELTVLVRGGGRWGRTIVSVLFAASPPDARIVWLAGRGLEAAKAFAAAHAWPSIAAVEPRGGRLQILPDLSMFEGAVDAAVIASATYSRDDHIAELISQRPPRALLAEKPFATSLAAGNALLVKAQQAGVRCLIDLEYRLASYIVEAAEAVADWPIASIELEWFDPAFETRNGEPKTADWITHIARDQGSHGWSLLDRLAPGRQWKVTEADLAPLPAYLTLTAEGVMQFPSAGRMDPVLAKLRLSRRAEARRRYLSVNSADGRELTLDFTVEPGILTIDGECKDTMPSWQARPRPLAGVLTALIRRATGTASADADLIDAEACCPALSFVDEAEYLCRRSARDVLSTTKWLTPHVSAALIDCLLPDLAAMGWRVDLRDDAEAEQLATALWQLKLRYAGG